mmetsp:Transcript_23295/g.64367  ORF Transcript_23295/g.64367 Transcript_23295/m.64367 type:complete len:102 (-) Transcript_23295:581-886(-)
MSNRYQHQPSILLPHMFEVAASVQSASKASLQLQHPQLSLSEQNKHYQGETSPHWDRGHRTCTALWQMDHDLKHTLISQNHSSQPPSLEGQASCITGINKP